MKLGLWRLRGYCFTEFLPGLERKKKNEESLNDLGIGHGFYRVFFFLLPSFFRSNVCVGMKENADAIFIRFFKKYFDSAETFERKREPEL